MCIISMQIGSRRTRLFRIRSRVSSLDQQKKKKNNKEFTERKENRFSSAVESYTSIVNFAHGCESHCYFARHLHIHIHGRLYSTLARAHTWAKVRSALKNFIIECLSLHSSRNRNACVEATCRLSPSANWACVCFRKPREREKKTSRWNFSPVFIIRMYYK